MSNKLCLFFLLLSPLCAQTAWQGPTVQGSEFQRAGRYQEADRCYRRAVALVEAAKPAEPLELATALQNLASLELLMGRPAQAEPLYRRALDLRAPLLAATDPRIAVTLHGLAEALHERRRYVEAEELYRRAAAILEAAYGPASLSLADVRHNWAALYRETGRDTLAAPLLESAGAIYEKAARLHPKLAIILRNQAELEAAAGRAPQAQQLFDRSLRICEAALPAGHPQTGVILQAYARFLNDQHRKSEAAALNRRAQSILGAASTIDVSSFR